jgi:hypothetical protein
MLTATVPPRAPEFPGVPRRPTKYTAFVTVVCDAFYVIWEFLAIVRSMKSCCAICLPLSPILASPFSISVSPMNFDQLPCDLRHIAPREGPLDHVTSLTFIAAVSAPFSLAKCHRSETVTKKLIYHRGKLVAKLLVTGEFGPTAGQSFLTFSIH